MSKVYTDGDISDNSKHDRRVKIGSRVNLRGNRGSGNFWEVTAIGDDWVEIDYAGDKVKFMRDCVFVDDAKYEMRKPQKESTSVSLSIISEATAFLTEDAKLSTVKKYLQGSAYTDEQIEAFASAFEKNSPNVSDADRVSALEEYDDLTFGDDDGKVTPEMEAEKAVTKKYPWFAKAINAAENAAEGIDDAPKSFNKDSVNLISTASSRLASIKSKLSSKKIDNAEKEHRVDGILGDLLDCIDKLEKELK